MSADIYVIRDTSKPTPTYLRTVDFTWVPDIRQAQRLLLGDIVSDWLAGILADPLRRPVKLRVKPAPAPATPAACVDEIAAILGSLPHEFCADAARRVVAERASEAHKAQVAENALTAMTAMRDAWKDSHAAVTEQRCSWEDQSNRNMERCDELGQQLRAAEAKLAEVTRGRDAWAGEHDKVMAKLGEAEAKLAQAIRERDEEKCLRFRDCGAAHDRAEAAERTLATIRGLVSP